MAENEITTLAQLRKLAEASLRDSKSRISEVLELVIPALENAQHFGVTVTLPAADWSDDGAQTIQNDFLLANSDYWYFVLSDPDNTDACGDAGITADNITADGQITFRCMSTPEVDLIVHILRLEVETTNE